MFLVHGLANSEGVKSGRNMLCGKLVILEEKGWW